MSSSVGGVGEGLADAVGTEDRQAVAAQHQLGAAPGHLPERRRPVAGEALHLLRVAGVRHGPDEQVARVQHAELGDERPRRIIGLAAGVVQLERQPALRERHVVAVGDVGVAVVGRPGEPLDRQGELPLVDGRVPALRPLVSAEVVRELVVGIHDRGRPAPLGRLGVEPAGAEDVVDVVMAVDGRAHRRVRPPAAHLVEDVVAVVRAASVEHGQPVTGVDGVDGGDRDHREDTRSDLLGPPIERRRDRVVGVHQIGRRRSSAARPARGSRPPRGGS